MCGKYDFLIVGAGLFGATCAYELTRRGFHCLVVEKRSHLGGNCYTEVRDGINIHVYGPHIFHTASQAIWQWMGQFAAFNHYRHRVKVNFNGRIYSFPPNLSTFNELWGIGTPTAARRHFDSLDHTNGPADTLETWSVSKVGREIYDLFIKGYTEKQWMKSPTELPASIIKRIPVRLTYDDSYFEDPYQGVPIGGYSRIFQQLLSGSNVLLNTDYFEDRTHFDAMAARILYTGPIDRFYDYRFGKLEYRSVRFEHELLEIPDFQGIAQMNYTSAQVPYTRIVEHKHFEFGKQPVTWITKEYPVQCTEGQLEMYPIRDSKNIAVLERYHKLRRHPEYLRYFFGGRLAEYQYYDMHQVIGSALHRVEEIVAEMNTAAGARVKTAVG